MEDDFKCFLADPSERSYNDLGDFHMSDINDSPSFCLETAATEREFNVAKQTGVASNRVEGPTHTEVNYTLGKRATTQPIVETLAVDELDSPVETVLRKVMVDCFLGNIIEDNPPTEAGVREFVELLKHRSRSNQEAKHSEAEQTPHDSESGSKATPQLKPPFQREIRGDSLWIMQPKSCDHLESTLKTALVEELRTSEHSRCSVVRKFQLGRPTLSQKLQQVVECFVCLGKFKEDSLYDSLFKSLETNTKNWIDLKMKELKRHLKQHGEDSLPDFVKVIKAKGGSQKWPLTTQENHVCLLILCDTLLTKLKDPVATDRHPYQTQLRDTVNTKLREIWNKFYLLANKRDLLVDDTIYPTKSSSLKYNQLYLRVVKTASQS